MRAEPHELFLLHHECFYYQVKARRGWYYKGEWVGYNVRDAIAYRVKIGLI